jgi:hypothetical protein
MGATFSANDYIKQIRGFSVRELTREQDDEVKVFLMLSEDFFNVFTSSSLDDYRQLKKANANNLIFLISQVRSFANLSNHLFRLPKLYMKLPPNHLNCKTPQLKSPKEQSTF